MAFATKDLPIDSVDQMLFLEHTCPENANCVHHQQKVTDHKKWARVSISARCQNTTNSLLKAQAPKPGHKGAFIRQRTFSAFFQKENGPLKIVRFPFRKKFLEADNFL